MNITQTVWEKVIRERSNKIERKLSLAFYHGYDGMDIIENADGTKIKCQPWYGENKPDRPPWANYHSRYDFRGIMYKDLREMLIEK